MKEGTRLLNNHIAATRTNATTAATTVALTATLGVAAASWVVAVRVMNVTWMFVIAALILAQKLLPARAGIDVPLALAIVGLGLLMVIAPSSVPGLAPAMSYVIGNVAHVNLL